MSPRRPAGAAVSVACAVAAQSLGSAWALLLDPFADPRRQVMVNMGDVEYVSYFTVGKQTLSGVFDTGSFELVIFSSACKTCGNAAKYDPSLSEAHKLGFLNTMQSYGSGDTYSKEASDEVAIGPYSERRQMFWEVVDARMPRLRSTQFQAVVGVGPPEAPAADAWADAGRAAAAVERYFKEDKPPPPEVRSSAKEIIKGALELSNSPALLENFQVKTFSICMGAHPGSDGYFTWRDDAHVRKPALFTRVPITGDHSWSASLKNVRLSRPGPAGTGGLVSTSLGCDGDVGCTVLIDSGTSLIAAPSDVIKQIQDIVNDLEGDCTNLELFPTLMFEMGGNLLSLPPDAYVAAVVGTVPEYLQDRVHIGPGSSTLHRSALAKGKARARNATLEASRRTLLAKGGAAATQCKMLLMESYMESDTGGPLWIFGFPFFRKYYASFDLGDSSASRALYLAEAGDDCRPAERSSLARTLPHVRHIDVSKLAATPLRIGRGKIRRI